jgi:hypothetical protein
MELAGLDDGTRSIFPAMIAAATDDAFTVQCLHRIWLDPDRPIKALIPDPRRAMGMLLGHGVRIGFDRNAPPEVIAAGEGIETMLSLRQALPCMPAIASRLPISAPSSCPRRCAASTSPQKPTAPHATVWDDWRIAPAPTESRSSRSVPSSAISTTTCDRTAGRRFASRFCRS